MRGKEEEVQDAPISVWVTEGMNCTALMPFYTAEAGCEREGNEFSLDVCVKQQSTLAIWELGRKGGA